MGFVIECFFVLTYLKHICIIKLIQTVFYLKAVSGGTVMKSLKNTYYEYDKLQAQLENIRAYKVTHGDTEYHTHANSCYDLAYVEKGYATHTVEGRTCSIRAGDFFIIDTDCYHSFSNADDYLSVFICGFNSHFLSPFHKLLKIDELIPEIFPNTNLNAMPIANTVFHDNEDLEVKKYFNNIITEYDNRAFGFREAIRSNIMLILLFMVRTNIPQEQPLKMDIPTFLINYINMHFTEKITLTDIAYRLNYSHSSLSRLFKQTFGCSFTLYLQQKRISYSCLLLGNTQISVEEIAATVGYDDTITFRETFKKYTQLTPNKFRAYSRAAAHCQHKIDCHSSKRNLTCPYNNICWGPYMSVGSVKGENK